MSLKIPVSRTDHYRGSLKAKVTLVEYGDYECPFCAAAYPELERVIEHFGDHICFVYRHFPLRNIHPHAELAANSAEAAASQDYFWQMHELLYLNSSDLTEIHIMVFAEELDLNMAKFERDMRQANVRNKISNDFYGGVRGGVNGTPTVFLNGERFNGPPLYSVLDPVINKILTTPDEMSHYNSEVK